MRARVRAGASTCNRATGNVLDGDFYWCGGCLADTSSLYCTEPRDARGKQGARRRNLADRRLSTRPRAAIGRSAA